MPAETGRMAEKPDRGEMNGLIWLFSVEQGKKKPLNLVYKFYEKEYNQRS